MSSNIAATSDIILAIVSNSQLSGATAITGVTGCGATWTIDTNLNNGVSAIGTNPTPGPCTISFTSGGGGFPNMCAAAVHGSVGGVDNHSGIIAATGGTAPAVTATGTADMIVGLYIDPTANGGASNFTAGTGYGLNIAGGYGCAIESRIVTSAGSYAPTITYTAASALQGASTAIKP